MTKFVVIVQCEKTSHRCSGLNCTRAFYEKSGKFEGYDPETKYMTFACGGCSGQDVASKIQHLDTHLHKFNVNKEDVIVHLASCIVSENYHRTPCIFKNEIKKLIERKGFKVVLGSFISKKAEEKRQKGIYRKF